MTNRSMHFTTGGAFAEWFKAARAEHGHFASFGSDMSTADDGLRALTHGDESHLTQAQSFLDKIQSQLDIEVPSYVWQSDLTGAFPNVPAYIAGFPDDMYNLVPDMSDKTPLRIFVGLTSSGMISQTDLVRRGCVLAAFAIAISKRRPVLITPYVNLGSGGYRYRRYASDSDSDTNRNMLISWDVQTSPLVLSELMAALSMPEVTRYVGIEGCRLLFGREARNDPAWHNDAYNERKMREHLGAKDEDLYLPSIYGDDPLLADPLGWLTQNIAHYADPDTAAATLEEENINERSF